MGPVLAGKVHVSAPPILYGTGYTPEAVPVVDPKAPPFLEHASSLSTLGSWEPQIIAILLHDQVLALVVIHYLLYQYWAPCPFNLTPRQFPMGPIAMI